jgi:hypothetical protein
LRETHATSARYDEILSNKYVIAYLTGKKQLPSYPTDYYGFGDEDEAMVYTDMHLHLWGKIHGLTGWLKNSK